MLKQQKSYFQASFPLNDVFFMSFLFFCLKQNKIKFWSCIFPKKYSFLLMIRRSQSRPFFFNAALAPLKKGRLLPAPQPWFLKSKKKIHYFNFVCPCYCASLSFSLNVFTLGTISLVLASLRSNQPVGFYEPLETWGYCST